MRYVRLCLNDLVGWEGVEVGLGDVERVVTPGVIGRDISLELPGFLRGYERERGRGRSSSSPSGSLKPFGDEMSHRG